MKRFFVMRFTLVALVVWMLIAPSATEALDVSITTTPRTWHAVAFPVGNSSLSVALDELYPPDVSRWRFGHWSPTGSTYLEAGGNLDSLVVGQGYWLMTSTTTEVRVTGIPLTGEYSINLASGPGGDAAWNQIGNPFPIRVPANGIRVTDGTTTHFLNGPANQFTERFLKGWDGTRYVDCTVMEPNTAYWIRKLAPGIVRIIIPHISTSATPSCATTSLEANGWSLTITAQQDDLVSEPLTVGAAAVPAGEWSPLARALAPAPPGDHLELYVQEDRWGRLSGKYVQLFRPEAKTMSWEFFSRGGRSPGTISLSFEAVNLPTDRNLQLEDLETGYVIAVRPGDFVTFVASAQVHHFRLTVSADDVGDPTALGATMSAISIAPNPFTNRTGIRVFHGSHSRDLYVTILDAAGREIRELRATGGPGVHTLVWDGRDAHDRPVAAGVYMARCRIGQEHRMVRLVKIE